ncbi:MAG: PD-(D/E)XK nuclease family protein [Spirochaetaceae bacterium]|nr:MAG: PD-(D/E)XK nuclease family protein [Spirochaetaceae bacterium]
MGEYQDAVAKLIAEAGQGCNFVFPSETVARDRRNAAASPSSAGTPSSARAVRADRFLSWDSFKESAFFLRSERRPVNSLIRRLFAELLTIQNLDEPFLEALVPRSFAANSGAFAEYISLILPSLAALLDETQEADTPILGTALFEDYRRLSAEYQEFLDRHGLFEPASLRPERLSPARHTYIFFSDTIDDFSMFSSIVADCKDIRVVPTAHVPLPELRVYGTAIEEIRAVLDEIEQALDSGVAQHEIMLTIGNPDSIRPFLESEARLREIPLQFRGGAPLTDSIGAGIFPRLLEAAEGGYTVAALAALIRNPAVPWRNPQEMYSMLDGMVEHGAEGRATEVRTRLKTVAKHNPRNGAALLGAFERFSRPLEAMGRAGSFRTLQTAVMEFGRELLDSGAWDTESERVYERALVLLQELVGAAEYIGEHKLHAARIWVSLLRKESYVPRRPASGIPVYSYRVAAGSAPRLHFVMGTTQRNCRLKSDPFSFVREDHKAALGLSTTDQSEAVLRLYAASGERVVFSASRDGFHGAELPEPAFSLANAAHAFHRDRSKDRYIDELSDPLSKQARYPVQQLSRSRLRDLQPNSRPPGLNLTPLSAALREAVTPRPRPSSQSRVAPDSTAPNSTAPNSTGGLAATEPEAARIALSSGPIEAYRNCPFGYLLQHGLKLREVSSEREYESALDTGTLYHRILEVLFRRIAAEASSDGAFRSSRLPVYRTYLEDAVRESLESWAPAQLALDSAAYPAVALRAGDYLGALLEQEVELLEGASVMELEKSLHIALAELPVLLSGRIDRIAALPDGEYVFLDYKRKNIPKSKQLTPGEHGPESLQLPLYDLMLREEYGRPAQAAYYVGIESTKYEAVFGPAERKSYLDAEHREAAVESVRALIQSCVAGIQAGEYQLPDAAGCENCDFPGICRAKFHLQFA